MLVLIGILWVLRRMQSPLGEAQEFTFSQTSLEGPRQEDPLLRGALPWGQEVRGSWQTGPALGGACPVSGPSTERRAAWEGQPTGVSGKEGHFAVGWDEEPRDINSSKMGARTRCIKKTRRVMVSLTG